MSNEVGNESIEAPSQPDVELDIIGKLETAIKARNKITRSKDISLPTALDNTELKDILDNMDNNEPIIAQTRLSKHVQDNKRSVRSLIDNISKLKHSSELKMNFAINNEIYEDDELNRAMSRMRQQSEKLFKDIIGTQVRFNECLNDNSVVDDAEEDHLKNHMILIQQTCKFDRGVESLFSCDKKVLQKHVEKDLSINAIDEFNKVSNDLAQGALNTVCTNAMTKSKNHEHLLAIQKYNESSAELEDFTTVQTGLLDPFTRKLITKPVTNKQCKHIYDEESIDLMFQNKLFICCPHIGCANKRFTKKDLLFNENIQHLSE